MSLVRMHFWTLVARGYGAGTTPVRYGTNGTMPATVNSSDGSSDTSEADWAGQSYRVTRYTSRWLEGLHLKAYKTYQPSSLEEIVEGEEKTWAQSPFEGMKVVASEDFTGVHRGKRVQKKDDDGNRMVIYAFMENKKGFALVGYWRTTETEPLRSLATSSFSPLAIGTAATGRRN